MILSQILVNPQQNVIHNYAVFYKQGCSKTKAKIDIMVKVGQGGVAGHLRPNILAHMEGYSVFGVSKVHYHSFWRGAHCFKAHFKRPFYFE